MSFDNKAVVFIFLVLFSHFASVQAKAVLYGTDSAINLSHDISYFKELDGQELSFSQVKQQTFIRNNTQTVNLGLTAAPVWLKVDITNGTQQENLFINIAQSTLQTVEIYYSIPGHLVHKQLGLNTPPRTRVVNHQNYIFQIPFKNGESKTLYIKVQSRSQINIPVTIGSRRSIYQYLLLEDIIFGCFIGILLAMMLYNIFIYFSTRDKSYGYYVLYICTLILSQSTLDGYAYKFLWSGIPLLREYSIYIFPSLGGLFAIFFAKDFLHVKQYAKRYNKILNILSIAFGVSILLGFLNIKLLSFSVMQGTTFLTAIVLTITASVALKNGFKPAKYFLVAWSSLTIGAVFFVLKDFNIVPANYFTANLLKLGSSIEVVLLSFALANKINIYKKEKEESQELALQVSRENERLVKEQNIVLESKVKERTIALEKSNVELNKTLEELKDAQTQLVESEKMASLGQLTAGIAHEINNPINFVTSNVNPLQRDIDMLDDAFVKIEVLALTDITKEQKQTKIKEIKEEIEYDYLKEEIQFLLKGIREGSSRTAEIVKGLRIFSRVDEDDLKTVDIHEGIDATLVIINTLLNNSIEVIKNYGNLPPVDCYPGKLNQVFINIISNGIHAVKKRWNDKHGGKITITTSVEGKQVVIKLADNGTGMDEMTMKRIFEPFFTTKDVGEGTGLGLSIVYNIMKKHNATINVESTVGVGTTFIITLPINSFSDGQ